MKQVIIFSDGSSLGNPGPGGYGTILRYQDPSGQVHEMELSAGYRMTTNNRMELLGAISGLEALNYPCKVDLYSDSQYVIKAFTEHWVDGWLKSDFKRATRKMNVVMH
jgi:ribonuclease HI